MDSFNNLEDALSNTKFCNFINYKQDHELKKIRKVKIDR